MSSTHGIVIPTKTKSLFPKPKPQVLGCEQMYPCTIENCNKIFQIPSRLTKHLKTAHLNGLPARPQPEKEKLIVLHPKKKKKTSNSKLQIKNEKSLEEETKKEIESDQEFEEEVGEAEVEFEEVEVSEDIGIYLTQMLGHGRKS